MRSSTHAKNSAIIRARFRVLVGNEVALGPGKAELLIHLRDTGSIAEAARRMGMSYMRAWTMLKTMERCFKQPLAKTARGGSERGGATLTETGEAVLTIYGRMQQKADRAIEEEWSQLQRLLRG